MSQFKKYMSLINEMKKNPKFDKIKNELELHTRTPSLKMGKLIALVIKYRDNQEIPEFTKLIENYSSLFSTIGDYNDYDYEYNSYYVKERYKSLDQMITDSFEKYLEDNKLAKRFETFKKMLKKTGSKYDIVKEYIENGDAGDLLYIIESLKAMKDNTDYEEEIKAYDANTKNRIKFAQFFPVKVENVRYQIKEIIKNLNEIKELLENPK